MKRSYQQSRARTVAGLCVLAAAIVGLSVARAQVGPNGWNYTLLPGSTLIDQCPICGRPDIIRPLAGTFRLDVVDQNPLFSTYAWNDIQWSGSGYGVPDYKITGKGAYRYGGELAVIQDLYLSASIDDGFTNMLCLFTNGVAPVSRVWPMIQVSVDQTNGTPTRQFHLDLVAAPLREIWFSTAHGFHAGIWNAPTNYVAPGDLVSSTGRVVRRNAELLARFGLMPIVGDMGLDAVDVLPGGEIAFSIETNAFSEILGETLHDGDVLSDRGRVITNYSALSGAFGPMPPAGDEGLDALQVMDNGEIYFSFKTDFFSESQGQTIHHGDLLSSRGVVVRSNQQLLAAFKPGQPEKDYGLDAVCLWPQGEIWFSVETGFTNTSGTYFGSGDLLSDRGYVVYRNLDLLQAFQPLEDLADFGLDALFVVTDARPLPAGAETKMTGIVPDRETGQFTVLWSGGGRVFQLEQSTNILGPFVPVSPIMTDSSYTGPAVSPAGGQGFYRVRQW